MSRAAALIRVTATALRADPPARPDAFGDPLPPGAVSRLGTNRLRHPGSVHDLAFSPDGARLAVTSGDGRVTVCDAETGRYLARADTGGGAGVAFAADGRTVGTFAEKVGLRVIDQTGRLLREEPSDVEIGRGYGTSPWRPPVLAPGWRRMAYLGDRGRSIVVIDPTTGRDEASYPS